MKSNDELLQLHSEKRYHSRFSSLDKKVLGITGAVVIGSMLVFGLYKGCSYLYENISKVPGYIENSVKDHYLRNIYK